MPTSVVGQGNMTISHRTSTKQLTLYPPTKPNIDLETPLWVDGEESDEEGESHQVLSIDQYLAIRDKIKDDEINNFIASSSSSGNTHILEHVMKPETQVSLASTSISPIEHEPTHKKYQGSLIETIEIIPGKTLKINRGLTEQQKEHWFKCCKSTMMPSPGITLT
jgi:hypothetical protein